MMHKRSECIHTNYQFYSNMMSRRKRSNAKNDTNVIELRQFLSIQMIMAIYKFPRIEMYWNSHASVPIISQTITLQRFYQLRTAIHLTKNDVYNTNDRFWEVQTVFKAIRQGCFFLLKKDCHSNFSPSNYVVQKLLKQ